MSNMASLSVAPALAVVSAEIAKVPKSDAAVVWNATAQTTIQTKAAAAIVAYDPPSWTEMDAEHALLATAANLALKPTKVEMDAGHALLATAANLALKPTKAEMDAAHALLATAANLALKPTKVEMDAAHALLATAANLALKPTKAEMDAAHALLATAANLANVPLVQKSSQAAATTTGVIRQDGVTGTPNTVLVQSSSSANTFGVWSQLDASTSADSWISHLTIIDIDPGSLSCCIELGIGAAGSEVTIIRFAFHEVFKTAVGYIVPIVYDIVIPKKVVSGTRIAARASTNVAVGHEFMVGLSFYQVLET